MSQLVASAEAEWKPVFLESRPWHSWSQQCWQQFLLQGVPTTREEDWKYTSSKSLEQVQWKLALADIPEIQWEELQKRLVLPDASYRLVFVDGHVSLGLSNLEIWPKGLEVRVFSQADHETPWAGLKIEKLPTAYSALGQAMMQDGFHLRCSAAILEPVLMVHVSTQKQTLCGLGFYYEVVSGGSVALVEQFISWHEEPYWVSGWTKIEVDDGGHLTTVKVQDEGKLGYHTMATQAKVKSHGVWHNHAFVVGGLWGRHDICVHLAESEASVLLNGMNRLSGNSFQDVHSQIYHDQAYCRSQQYYKGILDDSSRMVFNGQIKVEKSAQHTVSNQINHHWLLSDRAEVDTKPQLEILADDVICTHGATIGQWDQEQWFYLRSRGIAADQARAMLMDAFALELVDLIEFPGLGQRIKDYLRMHSHA